MIGMSWRLCALGEKVASCTDKIRDTSRRYTFYEVIKVSNREKCILAAFQRLVNCTRDSEVTTEEVMNDNKDFYLSV